MVSAQDLFEVAEEALLLAAVLSLPIIGAALTAALLSGLLQSFTKISDPSLSAVPRIVIGVVAVIIASPWIGSRAAAFAERAWSLMQALHS